MSSPSGPSTQTPGSRSMISWLAKAAAKYSRLQENPENGSGLGFGPVVADAHVDGQLGIEVVRAAHLGVDELAHLRDLRLRNLEQELVVHLEDEPCASPLLAEPPG